MMTLVHSDKLLRLELIIHALDFLDEEIELAEFQARTLDDPA